MTDLALVRVNKIVDSPVEHQGERVITLRMMDDVHDRPDGTAGRNFREHRSKLIEGEDYFVASSDEIRRNSPGMIPASARREDIILLAESGYLMLVKSFTDPLAWEVQRGLVNHYFRSKSIQTANDARDWTPILRSLERTAQIVNGLAVGQTEIMSRQEQLEADVREMRDEMRRRFDDLSRRKEVSARDKARHSRVIAAMYHGMCPLIPSIRVIEPAGGLTSDACFDHFYSKSENKVHQTWLVSKAANQRMEQNDQNFLAQARLAFDLYQSRRESWEQEQQPNLPFGEVVMR